MSAEGARVVAVLGLVGYVLVSLFVARMYRRAWESSDRLAHEVTRMALRLRWTRVEVLDFFSVVTATFWPVTVPVSAYWALAHRVRIARRRRRAGRRAR